MFAAAHRPGPARDGQPADPRRSARSTSRAGSTGRPHHGRAAGRRRGGLRARVRRRRQRLLLSFSLGTDGSRGRPAHLRARRLHPDGRQGGLPPRGARRGRPRPRTPWTRPASPPTSSAWSSRTRPTSASSRRPASASASTMDRAVVVLDRYGNTSSASIPLAVGDARDNGRVKPGDLALLTGFGAGMTWAQRGRKVVGVSGPSLVILAAGRARRYGGLKQLAPVGLHGEGVIDLLASDAYAAGFDEIVIVVNPDTGPTNPKTTSRRTGRASRRVAFAVQESLRGTVDAVLAAERRASTCTRPFAVSNADDLYGRDAFAQLGRHLAASPNHCLVGYRLDRALVGELPVSRGACNVVNGHLTDIFERRNVHVDPRRLRRRRRPGARASCTPQTIVSMNLWGFQPSILAPMREAVADPRLHRRARGHAAGLRRLDPAPLADALRRAAHDVALHRRDPRRRPPAGPVDGPRRGRRRRAARRSPSPSPPPSAGTPPPGGARRPWSSGGRRPGR